MLGVGASPAALFVVNAGTFVFSALVIVSIRRDFGRGSTAEHPGVLAGFRLVAGTRALRVPVLAGMISLVGIGIVDVASYPLSLDLGGGTAGYGGMTALLGGGGVVGRLLQRARYARMLCPCSRLGSPPAALALH